MYLPKRYTHIQVYKLSPFQITKAITPIPKKKIQERATKTTGGFFYNLHKIRVFFKNLQLPQKRHNVGPRCFRLDLFFFNGKVEAILGDADGS